MLDPDTGVQHALRRLFDTFARTGSARAVVQAFAADGLLFPARVRVGERQGELVWMPLRHWRVLRVLSDELCLVGVTDRPGWAREDTHGYRYRGGWRTVQDGVRGLRSSSPSQALPFG
jgi:hypothetical protein